jgi:hypothetical protein
MCPNRFAHTVRSHGAIAMVVAASIPALVSGIEYSIVSTGVSDVVIAYRLNEREIAAAPPQRSFVMAVSGQQGVACAFQAQAEGSPIGLEIKALSAGFVGNEFLNWLSFSPYLSGSALRPCPEGRIQAHFSSPIVLPADRAGASVINGIVHLPLNHLLGKKKEFSYQPPAFGIGVELETDADGIYVVSGHDLQSIGVNLINLQTRMLRLFCNTVEVPIYVTNPHHITFLADDTLLFYGKFLRAARSYYTQYSNSNIYWLTWETGRPGVRIAPVSGAMRRDARLYQSGTGLKDLSAHDFYDTLHIEEDNDIRWLGNINSVSDIGGLSDTADEIDNWYWGFIGQDYATTFSLRLPAAANNPDAKAKIRAEIMGLTSVPGTMFDHNLALLLNNNPIGDTAQTYRWKGQTRYVLETAPFPVNALKADTNTITFLRKSDGSDLSSLNWVEIEYYRSFISLDDKIWFKNNPRDVGDVFQFELKGFSGNSIDLWDIGSSRLFTDFTVKNTGKPSVPSYSLVFQDSLFKASSYFAQTTGRRLVPRRIRLDTMFTGWDTVARADYIAVTVDSFLPLLQPLADAYAKRGLRVALVDVNDVYNFFSAGIRDPESIRSMMKFLFSRATTKPPRYLLLGGDATHDLDKNNRARTLIPTHLSRVPGWGPSSDDGYFAAMNDDRFPALSVGRFPAQTKLEMRSLVNKTVGRLASFEPGPWRDNLLLLGGWENDFTSFNNSVSAQVIGPAMNLLRMDADTGSPFYRNEFSASKNIADYINAGVYAINFNGHGGGNIWSDSKFFGYDDLDKLYNGRWGAGGRLPFIFSFTCLTGFFESVFYRSLGEELVRRDRDGALCFLGASAYTSKQANLYMNRILLDYGISGTFESVGELIRLTKMNMLARFGSQYLPVVRQYNLLGDPALPWKLAPDSLKISVADSTVSPASSLAMRGSCLPLSAGQVKVTVNADGKKWDDRTFAFSQGGFLDTVHVKDSVRAKSGVVRAYAWNDSQQVRGWSYFAKDEIPVSHVALDRETVRWGDTVFVSCTFEAPAGISGMAILCLYAISQQPPTARPQGGTLLTGLPMTLSSDGKWISGPLPLAYSGKIGDILFVKFRIIYSRGDAQISDTSRTFSFNVEGRPDLSFLPEAPSPSWYRDSIRVDFIVINQGNVAAPLFRTFFFRGPDNSGDTLGFLSTADSLAPGQTRSINVTIPDSLAHGDIAVTACLNADQRFSEIYFGNNCKTAIMRVSARDAQSAVDSLCSNGKGLCVRPAAPWPQRHRLFLFSWPIAAGRPLRTESSWAPLSGDSLAQFSVGVRPALSPGDSLAWIFRPAPVASGAKQSTPTGKLVVMRYDSSLSSWRYAQGGGAPSDSALVMRSGGYGPFSLGIIADVKAPNIRALVDGREIVFLDYAAKNKPFNILMNDPSGIVPSSVTIRLNNSPLAQADVSPQSPSNNYGDIAITAYPRKQRSVDSISVYAEDFAGNSAAKVFAYMQGEDLSISFLSCHPNPFTAAQDRSGKTAQTIRFAFLLTDVARDVSLTIYTIGGNVVWSWRQSTGVIGYQEVEWDGKTTHGYRIANGTYYAKLIATGNDKKAVKKIRIAKLEGY